MIDPEISLLVGNRGEIFEGRHPDGVRTFIVRPGYHPDPMIQACEDRRVFRAGIWGFIAISLIVVGVIALGLGPHL